MLERLYLQFADVALVSYFPEYKLAEEDDAAPEIDPTDYPGLRLSFETVEALLIQKQDKQREHLLIASYRDRNELLLRWAGESATSMRITIERLSLPSSYPSNLGERVFYLFKGHLHDAQSDGPVCLSQKVVAGKEDQLAFLIAKLTWVYSGRVINSAFYDEWKQRRTMRST